MLKNGSDPPWRCGVKHRIWYKEAVARNPELFIARNRKYRAEHAAERDYRTTVERRRKRIAAAPSLIRKLEAEIAEEINS